MRRRLAKARPARSEESQGSEREAAVTTKPLRPAMTARFALVASTSAPAGVCASSPATVAIDMTTPMLAASQAFSVSR